MQHPVRTPSPSRATPPPSSAPSAPSTAPPDPARVSGVRETGAAVEEKRSFWRHLRPLLRRYAWHLAAASLLCGIHGIAMALQNVYPKWFFVDVIEAREIPSSERWRRVAVLGAGYLAISIVMRMAVWHCGFRLFTWARERIVFDLRAQFFRHVNNMCLRFHGEHPSGELLSYLFGAPLANLMTFFQHASVFLPGSIVTVLWTLGTIWVWDPPIGCLLTITSLFSTLMMAYSRLRSQRIHSEFQSVEGDVSGRVADVLRGNKAVKLYAMEAHVLEDFEEQARHIGRKSFERDVRSHYEWMKQEGFSYFCYVALMAMCTWRVYRHGVGIGIVVSCFTSFQGLLGPLQQLFQAALLWGGAEASLARIGKVLDAGSTTPDPADPVTQVPAQGTIELTGVTFGYDADRPVLRDLNLAIRPGQRVALVGPSGAGKTTIAQLVLRFYDPQRGAVRIGGTDARAFAGAALRKHFGVVPQDPFIFRTSVRDNVRVARPDASDEAIDRACDLANAREFVDALPGRLDARVGEGGATLSGGQRQRLAIARALLADPEVFVFDEATSALDTVSERLIQDAFERGLGGRTAIFIAHRLATVKTCDRILVLAGGVVVQDGTYAELMARPGLFADLVHGQDLRA